MNMKKRDFNLLIAAVIIASLIVGSGPAVEACSSATLSQTKPAGKQAAKKSKVPILGTVQEYQAYVLKTKNGKLRAEAAERASALVEKGEGLTAWPDFLAALGTSKSTAPLQILLRYLSFPVAEVRLSAASSLLELARTTPAVKKDLTDLNKIASAASDDSDPRVRRVSRCVLFQIGRENLIPDAAESSPFVLEGYDAYKRAAAKKGSKESARNK